MITGEQRVEAVKRAAGRYRAQGGEVSEGMVNATVQAVARRPIKDPQRRPVVIKPGSLKPRTLGQVFGFSHVPRDRWEQAFGKWTPEKLQAAVAEQKERKAAAPAPVRAPAVHGDIKGMGRRLYRGFDVGLGREIHGKAHRRQVMAELGKVEAG